MTSGSPGNPGRAAGARAAAFVDGLRRGSGWMLAAAGALLVVAAVLPPLPLSRNVVNHLVVFDITQSMYVADQSEGGRAVSRLVFARNQPRHHHRHRDNKTNNCAPQRHLRNQLSRKDRHQKLANARLLLSIPKGSSL